VIFINRLRRRQSQSNDYGRAAIIFGGFILLSVAVCHGQSLGDVARQQRQKAKANHSAPKIITNEDIPESPRSASQAASDSSSLTRVSRRRITNTEILPRLLEIT
jgi:hypothetical protein